MSTSTGYETSGRTRQKERTRAALIQATRELLADGPTPTVEQAADRAGISRTTAYRYFANQRQLVAATYPEIEASSLLDAGAGEDPAARLEIVLERMTRQLAEHEPELRAQLRLSLDGRGLEDLPLRQGRGIAWIEEALAPLRDDLGAAEVRRLAVAIRAACGIEPLVWLTDVAKLSRPAAIQLMRGSARTLLEAATRGPLPTDEPEARFRDAAAP